MGKKILFLDLDGTLLDDDKNITARNRAALEKALARGHRVVIATGRPLSSGRFQSERLGLTSPGCYLIACNGGIVFDAYRKEVVYERVLPIETALKLIRVCDAHGIHVQTYGENGVLIEPHNEDAAMEYYCTTGQIGYQVVESFDTALIHCPPKVLAVDLNNYAALEALVADLRAQFSDTVDCFFSSRYYVEMVPKGINKGNAIRQMCQRLGVDIADSIAVGDSENDLPMIEAAGLGVAMANGSEQVKAAAGYITTRDNNHDGVAEVVEKFMLET